MATWNTEGQKTNPSSGTVLADTGQLLAQEWRATIILSATALANVKLQHRNANNNGNVKEQNFSVLSSTLLHLPLLAISVTNADERVRVVTDGVILGNVQASIFLEG